MVLKYDAIVRERQESERRKYQEERAKIAAGIRRDLAPHLTQTASLTHADV